MAKRSVKASQEGIREAKKAFTKKGWTQEYLAFEVNLKTRQPIWRFFTGQPVERFIFMEICFILGLNWREIAENPPAESTKNEDEELPTIEALVRRVRLQRSDKIQNQCGTVQLLDTGHPVDIDDVYIDLDVVEEIASREWADGTELRSIEPEKFDCLLGSTSLVQKQIAATKTVERYSKLRVLGKPGSGKSTFLRHLAMECNQGEFLATQVPIFITLRDFAEESRDLDEFSLLKYIASEFITSGISDPTVVETLLCEGRVLLLLDGFDELLSKDSNAVFTEIRRFSQKYQNNFFVVTWRTAGAKNFNLNCFKDVEIAPLTPGQVSTFANKWFATFTNAQNAQEAAVNFIKNLDLAEDIELRGLVTTPLFLNLVCSVFHKQENFPVPEAEFYKQCLELLLFKWDGANGIQRDEIYRGFLLPQKLKLLSNIAAKMFEKQHYFVKQQCLVQYIGDCLQTLANSPSEPEELQLDSESVLKAIELQHGLLVERVQGIFSFSYLAFQEYLTARKIVFCANSLELEKSLRNLVTHLTEPRWRKVFLLTTSMLRSPDFLVQLMKQEIDALIAQDSHLQEFLVNISQKSVALAAHPKRLNNRAIYLSLAKTPLTTVLAQQRLIQDDWNFSAAQQEVLNKYYDANELLLDCLNSNSDVSPAVRQEIEFTFLLPQTDLTSLLSS